MQVRDICTRDVVTIPPDATLIDAAETMRRCHVGTLVVCEEADGLSLPVGMLTDRDIVVSAVAVGLAVETLLVKEVMTRPTLSCRGSDQIFEVIATMRRQGVQRMPVTDGSGGLEGIVSVNDIWRTVTEQLGQLVDVMAHVRVREIRRRA